MWISTIERTQVPGWAQRGGLSGAPNRLEIDFADGRTETQAQGHQSHGPGRKPPACLFRRWRWLRRTGPGNRWVAAV